MASQTELQIVISAIDNSSKELERAKNALTGLGGAANEASKKNDNMAVSVFKGAAAWDLLKTGVKAAAGFLNDCMKEAADASKVQTQLNAVLSSTHGISGMTSKSINDIADNLEKMTNVDKDAIVAGQNMLLTFTRIGQDVFPQATTAMLNMATAMNNGMTPNAEQLRQTAMQLGIALNNPIDGIGRLTRVGVMFTETQKEQINNFIKAGETANAQKVILGELETEFGQLAEKSRSPMQQATRAVDELKKSLGQMLLPVVREYSAKITENVEKITTFIITHKDAIAEVGKLVAVGVGAIATVLMLKNAFDAITTAVTLFNVANRASTLAAIGAAGPMVLLIAIVAGAAVGVAYLADKFGGLGNAFKIIGLSLQAIGQVFVIAFKMLGNTVIGFLNSVFDKGNQAYNYISGLLKKVGVDIGTADLKIGFKFDVAESANALTDIGRLVQKMEADASAAKKAKSDQAQKQIQDEINAQTELAKKSAALQAAAAEAAAKEANAKDKAKSKNEDLKKSMADLTKGYTELKKSGEESLVELAKDHADKMSAITSEIEKVRKSMSELQKQYNQGYADDTKSVAEQVVATEEKVADLKKQIAAEEDAKKRQELQDQLNKEEQALKDSAGFTGTITAEITEARRRAGLTDLQRAIEDYKSKRLLAQQEFDSKMIDLQNELNAKQAEMATEIALYQAKQLTIQKMMDDASIEYAKVMDSHYKKTADIVNAEIDLFKALAQAIKDAQSAQSAAILTSKTGNVGISGKRAAGGPVGIGEMYLVGEKGPELFVPNGNGNIIPNSSIGGSSITVNITGNTISNKLNIRDIADQVGDAIMGRLRLNARV